MRLVRLAAVPAVLALSLVMSFAGSVAAATTTATAVRDACSLTGGAWGHGYVALRVQATEHGLSGVARIRFVASLTHQPRSGSPTWTLHQTQQHTSKAIPATAANHSRSWTAVWYFGGDTVDYRHRVEVAVWFLDAWGNVLATGGVVGNSC